MLLLLIRGRAIAFNFIVAQGSDGYVQLLHYCTYVSAC